MSSYGTFGSFEAFEDYGVKRYPLSTVDEGTLSHAWTERIVLETLTNLCNANSFPYAPFLTNHIAKFQSAYVENKYACLKIERVRGVELSQLLVDAKKGIDESRAVKICCELIQTIALLHECGISHRDLKMDNVIVRDDGTPVLIDWGAATTDAREHLLVRGSPLSNSIQQQALEAFKDKKLPMKVQRHLFGSAQPFYDVRANDCVQLAHLVSGVWTSCSSKGEVVCGAFGPHWDSISGSQNSRQRVTTMLGLFGDEVSDLYPDAFCNIIEEFVHPDEEKRLTSMQAWHRLWYTGVLRAPSGKNYDMRRFLDKPPRVALEVAQEILVPLHANWESSLHLWASKRDRRSRQWKEGRKRARSLSNLESRERRRADDRCKLAQEPERSDRRRKHVRVKSEPRSLGR